MICKLTMQMRLSSYWCLKFMEILEPEELNFSIFPEAKGLDKFSTLSWCFVLTWDMRLSTVMLINGTLRTYYSQDMSDGQQRRSRAINGFTWIFYRANQSNNIKSQKRLTVVLLTWLFHIIYWQGKKYLEVILRTKVENPSSGNQ